MLPILALICLTALSAWGQETYNVKIEANGNTFIKENVALPYTFSCDFMGEEGELDLIIKQLYNVHTGCCEVETPIASGNENVTAGLDGDNQYFTISAPFEGTAYVIGSYRSYANGRFEYILTISIPGYIDSHTGIEQVNPATTKSGQRYNLMGQPVGKDYKGIVIEDGKKILIK